MQKALNAEKNLSQREKVLEIIKLMTIYKIWKMLQFTWVLCVLFVMQQKDYWKKKNIPYKEINISLEEDKMEEMIKKSNGKKTIPQIFIEDFHVGGYVELRALENKKELDGLVK